MIRSRRHLICRSQPSSVLRRNKEVTAAIVPTDIAVAIPDGTYGRIAPRNGLAAKHHLAVGAGVIDADYRGNVGIQNSPVQPWKS